MEANSTRNRTYHSFNFDSAESIAEYSKQLEGKTFHDVLDLNISPDKQRQYGDKKYKGGLGTLIEERFYGYSANSKQEADFAEAKVELKVTCFDVKKNSDYSAGERLVLTMIPFDKPIEKDFFKSHLWEKSHNIMLVYYERNREIESYDQKIHYTFLFTPPQEDLEIIKADYEKITSYIEAGKADELSESMTSYLGACTKGASRAKMWVEQYYPPHTKARKRAFCFKRQYMDYVLHHYIMGLDSDTPKIVQNPEELKSNTLENIVLSKINKYVGTTDKELCELLNLPFTGNKAQWNRIVYSLLGVNGEEAEEFKKANISVRAIRVEENKSIKESLSLDTIKFLDLVKEDWDSSYLRTYFEETRFLFVHFQKKGEYYVLAGAKFWSMPQADLDGPLHDCWKQTIDTVNSGVEFDIVPWSNGTRVENNLPSKSDNRIAHVRPHSAKAWYRFLDGTTRGDNPAYGDALPDGQEITKQSFWLNDSYIYSIITS